MSYDPLAWERLCHIPNLKSIYDEVGWTGYRDRNRRVIKEILGTDGPWSALDAGCFIGMYSPILDDCGAAYTGIDITPKFIAEAKMLYPRHEFLVADVESLPFASDSFDLVFCFGLLIHLSNPQKAISELWRVTRRTLLVEASTVLQRENMTTVGGDGPHFCNWGFNCYWMARQIEENTDGTVTSCGTVRASARYPEHINSTLWRVDK